MIVPVGVDRPLMRKPYVTLSLIGINCVVFFFINPISPFFDPALLYLSSMPGYDSLLTLFTPMFLHGGITHLFFNMIFFLVPGMKLEDAMGPWKFLLFYLACGVAAQAGHTLLSGTMPFPSLGASGAIAGVMGGFMVLYPRNRIKFFYWVFAIFYGVFFISAWVYLLFWFLKEIVVMLVFRGIGVEAEVAFGAHIGGFAAGAIWMWAFYGWNRGPELDDAVGAGRPTRVIVAPTMQPGGGRPQ